MEQQQELVYFLEKANQIAFNRNRQILANQTLSLLLEICQAEAGILLSPTHNDNLAKNTDVEDPTVAWSGCPEGLSLAWWEALRKKLSEPSLYRGDHARWIDRDTVAPEMVIRLVFANLDLLKNLTLIPLKNTRNAPGGVMLVNSALPRLELASIISSRLASELDKTAELEIMHQREKRLMALNDILGQLGASLNPDQVLRVFIERARQFLQVEAVSLFLIDPESGDLVLQMASQANQSIQVEKVRVPKGVGIIGRVTRTGETLLVEDVQHDQRHYQQVDQNSGFTTKSILAVPLRTRPIDLGRGRGFTQERIIGGLEAINKIGGSFKADDIELLEILAKGASTILVVAQLYVDANSMFFDVIQAMVSAIDAKDPYTAGHSERVSVISTEIARALGMNEDEIYHVRLGSLFHDVGKLGVPEEIIGKTGALNPQELQRVREQPEIGEKMLGNVRQMGKEIQALSEHHERLDGSGYPEGLRGDQIPLISRIVAVADVFDAMTSDRPYRERMPVEEVFEHLWSKTGTEFDGACVDALIRAYQQGRIDVQPESSASNAEENCAGQEP